MKTNGLITHKSFRLFAILILFTFLYGLLVLRLFYWQVVRAQELREIGQNQSTESIPIGAKRGEILSSDGFPLATNKISYLLYANPKVVEDRVKYEKLLSDVLQIPEASISAKLSQELFWVRLANNLSIEKKQEIEKLDLPALGFQEESSRFYPEASMSAQLIGFLGKDQQGKNHGYFGLEGSYNTQLTGRDGRLYIVKDALGNPVINDIREEGKIDGRSVSLTLDRRIQYLAERRLLEGIEKYQAEGGSVIIMEPKTGKILASASYPRFDPTNYWEFDSDYYRDPVISSLYEPGSTFKVLTMAAALDARLVGPDTRCTICSKPIQIGEYSIKTWNNKYYENSTMTQVIQHSDNTGMVFVGQKLGVNKMLAYLKRFGFGEDTDVDLQGEVSGDLRSEGDWRPIDLATASFGQGISVTPIQLLSAVSSIANKGILMQPYLVSKITTDEGKTIDIKPKEKRRTLQESTTKMMTWMMVNAVDQGEAKWTKIPDHKVAGKTGTAQVPVAGHYDPNVTIASFVGFFPADDPQISMLVLVNKPKTSIYGSETAAPIFFTIAKDIIGILRIPPSM